MSTISGARGLRRRLADYGDPEFSLFLRKAFIKAMGYGDEALARPIVGIANTHSDFNPCHGNVPQLIEATKRGVLLAGALPMVFPTISIHESFASPTSMYLRNLMAMETEEMIRAQPMDAVVLIGGCDKTIPAQLMAAGSSEVPAIVLPTGPMMSGHHRGRTLGACTDCRSSWARFRAGEISRTEIDAINDALVSSIGTCTVMGTASTMACLVETMGLCLPMAGSAPAVGAERVRLAEQTGHHAARLAAEGGPTVADILTPAVLRNAMVVLQALGGSTNGVVHLAAVAGRVGHPLDLAALDAIGQRVPVLVDLKPTGKHYMEHFHNAGGLPRLLREIAHELDLTVLTVFGDALQSSVDRAIEVPKQNVIRTISDPVAASGAIAVLSGNLAPRGAIIKQSAVSPGLARHVGRAVVFDSIAEMSRRIDDPELDVTAEDVLVLRNAGPKGAPGMPEAGYLPIPRRLASAGVTDMVRISDARMSGTAFGTVVLHVVPEASENGPLAAVEDGDLISLDIAARRLDLLVDPVEIEARLRRRPEAPAPSLRGYARLHKEHVTQADLGCDFDFLVPPSGAPQAGDAMDDEA